MSEDSKKTTQAIVNEAVEWLLKQQSKDGWQGDIRATCYAIQALILSGFGTSERSVELGSYYLCVKQDAETGARREHCPPLRAGAGPRQRPGGPGPDGAGPHEPRGQRQGCHADRREADD